METPQKQNLSVGRNIKIGFFHLGSGMADVIIGGFWNRIMVSDLGYAATPVSLLSSLRYFLAPLGIWAGRISDRRPVAGYRRMFWIWLGRAMMVLSTLGLGMATAQLQAGGGAAGMAGHDGFQWLIIAVSLLLFSLGGAISGSTFLALIYDRAPEKLRGRAVGIVWTFLLIGFAVGGFGFGRLLPEHKDGQGVIFTPESLQMVFVVGAAVMGLLWFFSVVGEERRVKAGTVFENHGPQEYSTSVIADLKLVFNLRPMRYFFWFLVLSMMFAFSQDMILEPFGGDVFKMDASITTRFTAYWASMAILANIVFLFLSRRFKSLTNTTMSYIGVSFLVGGFAAFTIAAFGEVRPLVTIGLVLLGIGLGIWNVGTTGLMMDMSPEGRAGTFLGFWTLLVTFARGGGTSAGGIVRDLGLNFTGSAATAYGICFLLGMLGLVASMVMLRQANIKAYKAEQVKLDAATALVGAMD
ncbi:MAG: BCD family MFS transporter [Chloroflexi bacterium]|nr:BCD family MFS transporter [Chloroflexota bacterium]MCC6896524.1 BCD family MFS transporter [Anaerolineae bacterium]